jgi:hypothetical protein
MSRTEYQEIPRQADTRMQEIALRLMGDCGLRVEETLHVTPGDVTRKKDGRNYKLDVDSARESISLST